MKKVAIISGCCIAAVGTVCGILYALYKMGKIDLPCCCCHCDEDCDDCDFNYEFNWD